MSMESYNAYLPYCFLWWNPLTFKELTKLIGLNTRAFPQQVTISFLTVPVMFSSTYPRKLFGGFTPGSHTSDSVTVPALWLLPFSLSLSLLLLLMWHPSNAKPLHSCFKFWCSLSCVLTWAEGHLLRLQVTSIIYLVPVLSVLMTRGYNCFQLHDKTLSWYEDTWTWSCSTASIHLHHWGFLWLCEHPQLRVWGKAEEHNSHTWWNQGQSGVPL